MQAAREAMTYAGERGLRDRVVFFNPGWLPYAERGAVLAEAQGAISLHRDLLETRLSFRTRLLDYLWAGLPSVLSAGDSLGEEMGQAGAARLLPPGDLGGLRQALLELWGPQADVQQRAHMSRAAAALARRYTWTHAAQPLLHYCEQPWRAPDREADVVISGPPEEGAALVRRALWTKAWQTFRREGAAAVLDRVRRRL
jgi:hypothetical protein